MLRNGVELVVQRGCPTAGFRGGELAAIDRRRRRDPGLRDVIVVHPGHELCRAKQRLQSDRMAVDHQLLCGGIPRDPLELRQGRAITGDQMGMDVQIDFHVRTTQP